MLESIFTSKFDHCYQCELNDYLKFVHTVCDMSGFVSYVLGYQPKYFENLLDVLAGHWVEIFFCKAVFATIYKLLNDLCLIY